MKKTMMPIGGEPFYSPFKLISLPKNNIRNYFLERFPGKHLTYTYGGYYSLRVILQHLKLSKDEKVLLPSYMCPTILYPLKELGIQYEFYKVNRNLQIDLGDLSKRVDGKVKVVFFINYFGFKQSDEVITAFLTLKESGIIIIQDVVQDFYIQNSDLIGNYAFMSFRKFFPCEGSIIITQDKIDDVVIKGKNKTYFNNKLKGRLLRYFHYKYGCKEELFLSAFKKANESYRLPENIEYTSYDEYVLNRIDFEKDKETRRENFKMLLGLYGDKAIFKSLPDNVVPLLFPIVISSRDSIQMKLRDKNVFCPVHWKLTDEFQCDVCKESVELSEKIMSISISNTNNYFRISL